MKTRSATFSRSNWIVVFAIVAMAAASVLGQRALDPGAKDPRIQQKAAALMPKSVLVNSFSEGFEGAFPPTSGGGTWTRKNQSGSIGTNPTCWNQFTGTSPWTSHGGTAQAGANFNCSSGSDTINGWLIGPRMTFNNGDQIKFWTRTSATSNFPDRLELRLGIPAVAPGVGATPNTGTTADDVGDFTVLLQSVNPTLTVGGYPGTFTQFTGTVTGLGAQRVGWFAFRYYVTNAGPDGANSNLISIDDVDYLWALASGVEVSGRVTGQDGRGITNAKVTIADVSGASRSVVTGRNGEFSFADVETGQTYVVSVTSRRFSFEPQTVSVSDNVSGIHFVPTSGAGSSR